MVHIGLVCWNRLGLTRICLDSLLALTPAGYSLTIVDNGSDDGTPEYLRQLAARHSQISLKLLKRNMGVSVASNLAWDDAGPDDCFVKLDNDMQILSPDWLENLLAVLREYPETGLVSYRLCDWHQVAGRASLGLASGSVATLTNACCGACVCIAPETHKKVGFWNEGYGRYGYEDMEYAWRVKTAGFKLAYLEPDGVVRHLGYADGAVNKEIEDAKQANTAAKLTGDVSFHCHLMLFDEGVIPLNIMRKYLPSEENGDYRFSLNPAYRPLQRLLQDMVGKVKLDKSGNQPSLDLGHWRKP